MKKTDDDVLNNLATLDDNSPPASGADLSCDEYMVFAMQDKHHRFSLGLGTVLECLHAAEKEGAVPELPPQWWLTLSGRYQLNKLEHSE